MLQTVLALLVFLFPLAYSPGPGNMIFAANGARFGFLATLPANLGYHLATWLGTFAIGLGFARLLEAVPTAFIVIKLAGVAYVLWLSWKLIRAGSTDTTETAKPPFNLPNNNAMVSKSPSAKPDFSSMMPINMNKGTAIKT